MERKIVVNLLQGYTRGEAFIEAERMANLRRLTPEAALAIFVELWKVWEQSRGGGDMQALDRLKIEHLVRRRRALDRLAERGTAA